MAAGQAREVARLVGEPVAIYDRKGKVRTHPLWRGLDWIATDATAAEASIVNGSGCRPYVDYGQTTPERWAYTDWRSAPGALTILDEDRGPASTVSPDSVLIEPNIKANASPNKRWPHWQALVDEAPDIRWVQLDYGQPLLAGVETVKTRTFFEAAAVLERCAAAVLPEGGMHHAAAAVGCRAAVIFGAMTDPRNTGYPEHINLWIDDPAARGWRIPHPAAEAAMAAITPRHALTALETILCKP